MDKQEPVKRNLAGAYMDAGVAEKLQTPSVSLPGAGDAYPERTVSAEDSQRFLQARGGMKL